jgi:chromosome segregation ATPase
MSQTDDGLTLDSVVKRFADSERALGDVREQLQSLASAATSADASAASLQESAESVRGFAESAAAAAGELREVTAQARAVLEGGAAVLDGSALRAIEERIDALASDLQRSQAAIEERLAQVDALAQRLDRTDRGAELIFKTLPGRWRKEEYPQE